MASYCSSCGARLPFLRKLGGQALCSLCTEKEKRLREAAEQEYEALLSALVAPSPPTSDNESRLPALARQAALTPARIHALHVGSFRAYMEQALADDCMTAQEEARMQEIGRVLGIEQAMFKSELKGILPRLIVARVNDGRLPAIDEPHIMLRKDEVAHLEIIGAGLLKETTVREWQGGYSGVSFRVAKGVRFHTGGTRGRSVVVGTKLEIKDTGILSVTSERAAYAGTRETIEMPYKKLVNLSVFEDGIQFHLSNRKNPPMFKLEQGLGEVVAAVVNAASQKYLS